MTPDTPALTLRNEARDFPEWHQGRPRYALWALLPEPPEVGQRVQSLQTELQAWLLPGYRRQPHVTLGLCGFPAAQPVHGDDFGPGQLQQQLRALRACGQAPFALGLDGPGSFTSVPYLGLRDPSGALDRLHACLALPGWQDPPGGYVPHVTLGLYGGAWPLAEMRARLDALAGAPALFFGVRSLQLLAYAAPRIGGPLQVLARYDLASGRLRWQDAAAAALLRSGPGRSARARC